jgi:hypothetical protein
MIKRNLTGILAILLVSLSIVSCNKDNGNPTIRFVTGPDFTGRDTIIKVNYTLKVGLEVAWNGVDQLQKLELVQNDALIQTFTISGDTARYDLNIIKGADQTEKWTFTVYDTKGNQSSISITLTKDPNSEYGEIVYYSPVVLGAQNNIAKAAFISFQTDPATLYNLDQAFINQSRIDLTFYSDPNKGATLVGPGSSLVNDLYPGSRSIANWTVRNAAGFLKTTLTEQDFNAISNDAEMVNGWDDTASVEAADSLQVGDIWLFKLDSGQKGIFRVRRIVSGDDGEIELGIKIQK